MLESHICDGCGMELSGVPAVPEPIYALPVCVCPGCGAACVRRKHRLRTYPVAFRRLDRAFNRLALSLGVVLGGAGTSLLIAITMAFQSMRRGQGPFVATYEAVRSAPPEELLSIGLIVGSMGMMLAISGVLLGRVLWHWTAPRLVLAWAAVLVVVSVLPAVWPLILNDAGALVRDLTDLWASRAQVLTACWVATALGVMIERAGGRGAPGGKNRRFRRSMKWARKNLARRRAG